MKTTKVQIPLTVYREAFKQDELCKLIMKDLKSKLNELLDSYNFEPVGEPNIIVDDIIHKPITLRVEGKDIISNDTITLTIEQVVKDRIKLK